jgi:hypothetical protein
MLKKFHDPPLGGAQPAARTPGEPPFPGLWGLLQGDTPGGCPSHVPSPSASNLRAQSPNIVPKALLKEQTEG